MFFVPETSRFVRNAQCQHHILETGLETDWNGSIDNLVKMCCDAILLPRVKKGHFDSPGKHKISFFLVVVSLMMTMWWLLLRSSEKCIHSSTPFFCGVCRCFKLPASSTLTRDIVWLIDLITGMTAVKGEGKTNGEAGPWTHPWGLFFPSMQDHNPRSIRWPCCRKGALLTGLLACVFNYHSCCPGIPYNMTALR